MTECRVERPGFQLRGRPIAQDRIIVVPDAIFALYGPRGTGALAFIRKRDNRPAPVEDQVTITPGALALANEHRITIEGIEGTGTDGRITKHDVQAYLRTVNG